MAKHIVKNIAAVNAANSVEAKTFDSASFARGENEANLHDQAFETKPVSFLQDSFRRFAKNKGSIAAAIVILIIALFGLIVPIASPMAHVDPVHYPQGYSDANFSFVTPCLEIFHGSGFWDGSKKVTLNANAYRALQLDDSNHARYYGEGVRNQGKLGEVTYSVRVDTYAIGNKVVTVDSSVFEKVYAENKRLIAAGKKSIMKPLIDYTAYVDAYVEKMEKDGQGATIIASIKDKMTNYYAQNASVYYALSAQRSDGSYQDSIFYPANKDMERTSNNDQVAPLYSSSLYEEHNGQYTIRVDYFDYFTLVRGFKPYYAFGANEQGQDLFLRLAQGTRFSLLLGIGISAINLVIGLIWGAVSGYYGGNVDLVMERVTDIIANIPSIVILTVASIQFGHNAELKAAIGEQGVIVLAFLLAFVYSGWVGVAGTTRMQFYRFKGQEYVLASRTLGAKDRRLIFRHILPNAAGTLVTSSVLMIPGVIFSESSLSYLGIISFRSVGLSSIGVLLDEGNGNLQSNPHVLLFPCLIISLLMISFNLFGNGLRDAFNTSLKGAED